MSAVVTSNRFVNTELWDRVEETLASVETGLARRLAMKDDMKVEEETSELSVVGDRVVSKNLAKIPGMDAYMNKRKQIRQAYANEKVEDPFSHVPRSRLALHENADRDLFIVS